MQQQPVGLVLGTIDAEPLEFWVGVEKGQYLQLDDVVYVDTQIPTGETVTIYGVVDKVCSRYEGTRFDSDVFLVTEGVLPAGVVTVAHVSVTRVGVDKEVFVPPMPGQPVYRALGEKRDQALFFDAMGRRFPAGLSRDGQVVWADLDFLDGTKGAHVNIAGTSGVATKTSYACFLLYSLFHHPNTQDEMKGATAVIFNVKGEDLLFLDLRNERLTSEHSKMYERMGLPVGPFSRVKIWAPPRPGWFGILADADTRQEGVTPYCWTLREFCQERLLRFLFAEAEDESFISYAVQVAERYLQRETESQPKDQAWVKLGDKRITAFDELVEHLSQQGQMFQDARISTATREAFYRRLWASVETVGHLIRGDLHPDEVEKYRMDVWDNKVNVISITKLHDRAKRFVVGVVLKQLLEEKDRRGQRLPLLFVVLDELNKYAPRDGRSPIKEVVLDIAERGRSLGIILIGAQQTASEVERRVLANSSFRVAGRLDVVEAERSEYGFLLSVGQRRATILKPGTLFLFQPQIPLPILARFPMPAWATRPEEAQRPSAYDRVRDEAQI